MVDEGNLGSRSRGCVSGGSQGCVRGRFKRYKG